MPIFATFLYLSAYLGAFLSSCSVNAAVITQTHTLYYVPQPITTGASLSWEVQETAVYKPIATLEEGSVTQYQKVDIQSLVVAHNPSPVNSLDPIAVTLVSQPITRTVTFQEGSATYQQIVPAATTTIATGVIQRTFAATENCSYDIPQKVGACVRVEEVPWFSQSTGGVSTVTESWTGSLVPYATITSTAEGPTSGSASRGPLGFGVALSVMAGLTGALLL